MLIRNREYTVEKKDDTYWFTGKKGAKYYTMRNRVDETKLFIVPENFLKGFATLDGVWLTDVTGELKVIKQ